MMKIEVKTAKSPQDYVIVRNLIQAYSEWLGIDLCFQKFDYELENLSEVYVRLYIACVNTMPVGCIGIKEFSKHQCELKRMFVKEKYRGKQVGRKMLQKAIFEADTLGYNEIILDTSTKFEAAIHLYKEFEFSEIPAHYHNPNEDVIYMSLDLSKTNHNWNALPCNSILLSTQ